MADGAVTVKLEIPQEKMIEIMGDISKGNDFLAKKLLELADIAKDIAQKLDDLEKKIDKLQPEDKGNG